MQFRTYSSPHTDQPNSVTAVMLQVILALIPGIIAMVWYFGWGLLINMALAIGFALGFEALMLRLRGRSLAPLGDLSALVTAVLFGLAVPPLLPWWLTVLGMGFAIVVGVLRIIRGWPLPYLIIGGYVGVVVMTAFAPKEIIGIAYDSGGVTTSTVTVPLVAALGIGLANSIRGRDPLIDGFGLIAFASLTPMIFVMGYGMLF